VKRSSNPYNPKEATMATSTNGKVTTIRSQARKVYVNVLENWAQYASDVSADLGMDVKVVNTLLRQLERRGLVASTHVNGERTLMWQTYHDVENEPNALAEGKAEFTAKWPRSDKGTTRPGGGGPRYTPDQLRKAKAAKAKGLTRKEVAAAAGIASPNYLAKLLRRMAQDEAKAAKAPRKRNGRKPTSKAA
jgi:hypothetical protein